LIRALAGRKIPYERNTYTVTVNGHIVGIGKTIRIELIALHYDLTMPPESFEATERVLKLYPEGCPGHQSIKGTIKTIWDANVHVGDKVVHLSSKTANE
jgi:hypothetical protein